MLIKQYEHRLPADHDLERIRARGRTRGALWDDAPGLVFKAFALRERGRHGAPHHAYTSIYLWHDEQAATDFVTGPRFRHVLDTFGRPEIRTWLPIAVQVGGAAREARSIYRHEFELDENTDLSLLRQEETQRATQRVVRDGALAALVGIDVGAWKLLRLEISAAPLHAPEAGSGYELAWLAAPGWARAERNAA